MTAEGEWIGRIYGRVVTVRKRDATFVIHDAARGAERDLDPQRLQVAKRWWWRELRLATETSTEQLGRFSRQDATSLDRAIGTARGRLRLQSVLTELVAWSDNVHGVATAGVQKGRWIDEESIVALESSRPVLSRDVLQLAADKGVRGELTQQEHRALEMSERDLRSWIASTNDTIVEDELRRHNTFFRCIETSPLTTEQARAVICYDNRVNLVASAGSGKTSVMVARAAYAVMKGFVQPESILLLAFNKAAAVELQERVRERFASAGLDSDGVVASTFHAFGLRIMGEATGRKPRLAPWLDAGQDVKTVLQIVDDLRARSSSFRYQWDLYRLLYARVDDDPEHEDVPDGYDKESGRTGLRTFNGEVVKSQGERLIADWLFLNGVDYRYEHPYSVDVADSGHSQYRPDFYYPAVDAWHEHWALNFDGKPPADFRGYEESMRWKKALHQRHGTTLVESTWAEVVHADGLAGLRDDLRRLGVELDWNPDRPIPAARPVRHEDLARLMRTFTAHVKSNRLDRASVGDRVRKDTVHSRSVRTKLFLELYWQVHDEWERRLAADGSVDFEDMLLGAADLVESGAARPEYDLVLVDEFQDASQARARLVASLVAPPGRHLLAVGDDWQAINRFAGADIAVMTEFERWFGRGQSLRLSTTFRCTQEICDVSSDFVTKNPGQIPKRVRSVHGRGGAPVLVTYAPGTQGVARAVLAWLEALGKRIDSGEIRPGRGSKVVVNALGRYGFDRDLLPPWRHPGVELAFRTVHASKGLEADFVIIPNMTRGTYGFPSQIADDPVLDLAMSQKENYEHAEERRLFYVAMTRARQEVVLVAVPGLESPFLTELLSEERIVVDPGGHKPPAICPRCREGVLVKRTGPYGEFLGCSSFPHCRHTRQLNGAGD